MSNDNKDTREVVDFQIKDFITACLKKWPWFLASLVICMGLAFFYGQISMPKYELSEEVLIQDAESSASIGDVAGIFSTLGFGGGNTDVYNEVIALNSPALMMEVIQNLDLCMNYTTRKGLKPSTLYGESLPFTVFLADVDQFHVAMFNVMWHPDGSAKLYKFITYREGKKVALDGEVEIKSTDVTVDTPVGKVKFTPNPSYTGSLPEEDMKIKVRKTDLQSAIENYTSQCNADLVDQDADVIGITIKDANLERGKAVLNEVLDVYSKNYIADKNKIAFATSKFIDERLKLIQSELGDVDSEIADYKTNIGSPDLAATTEITLKSGAEVEQKILELNNQASMIKYMEQYLENPENSHSVIPVNVGLDSEAISRQVAAYNDMMLQRNNLADNSSASNPLVANLDRDLNANRNIILAAVRNEYRAVEKSLANANKELNKSESKIRNTPGQENHLRTALRQQTVKESLYIFLLQKREENELSQKFTADNLRIITPPMGSDKPISPRKGLLLAVGFLLGVAIPLGWLYIKVSGDTKIHSRKDLDKLSMPFAGEIPQVGKRGKLEVNTQRKRRLKDEKPPMAVVAEGNRDVVNEAFRVIRSNLDFMGRKDASSKVIMLTSFNPGSGKSFIAYNLGLTFALKKKNVLIIDCDLRHGSSSMFVGMPPKGITDFLTGATDDWRKLVKVSPASPDLSVLPIGKIPPNPAELLEGERLQALIEQARGDYDVVILDCPPVNIVVDTQIIAPLADTTLFVARAGLFDKSAIAELNTIYSEKRYPRMSLILNGTDSAHSRYYTYGTYQSYS